MILLTPSLKVTRIPTPLPITVKAKVEAISHGLGYAISKTTTSLWFVSYTCSI